MMQDSQENKTCIKEQVNHYPHFSSTRHICKRHHYQGPNQLQKPTQLYQSQICSKEQFTKATITNTNLSQKCGWNLQ